MKTSSKAPIHYIPGAEKNIMQRKDSDETITSLANKISVVTVDKVNAEILVQIRDIAKRCGVTDVLVLDEEFIVTALKNEMERRKNG